MNVILIVALLLIVGANINNMVVAYRVRDKDTLSSNLSWISSAGTAIAAAFIIYALYLNSRS